MAEGKRREIKMENVQMFLNEVENPHNGPSAKLVYEGGGYMAFAKPWAACQ